MSVDSDEPVRLFNFDLKPFLAFYNKLPEKPSTTFRIFNNVESYSLFGNDAKYTANALGTILETVGDDPPLPYVTLRKKQFDKYIRELLLVRLYRVEVFIKQDANDWKLEYKGSPGNISQFEEIVFNSNCINFNNYVMAINITSNNLVSAACINSSELKIDLAELRDNDRFTELEALIAQIAPRECVIPPSDTPLLSELANVLQRNCVLVTKGKRLDFSTTDIMQDLNRLLYFKEGELKDASIYPETKMENALSCLNAAIIFLNLMGDEQNFNQFKLGKIDIHRYVRLDLAALHSLNILEQYVENNESSMVKPFDAKDFSVKGTLDKCLTPQGSRLLDQWVKQPLKDEKLIEERLNIVQCFVTNSEIRETLVTEILPRLSDLLPLAKKLANKKANLECCYKIYYIISFVPQLLATLKKANNPSIASALVTPLCEIYSELERYQQMIEEVLDLEMVERGEYLVKRNFDSELDEVYKSKLKVEEQMNGLVRKTSKDLGIDMKNIKLETNDQYGYFMRVTMKDQHALRSSSEKYEVLSALKGGVRFTTLKLRTLNEDYIEAREAYQDRQKDVIVEIFDVAAGYSDSLRNLNLYTATVDVLVAFAKAAIGARTPYVRPIIHKSGERFLKLTKMRHPCLEMQDDVAFIPNSIEFDKNKSLYIITGPNMCGKSTYIRSVAICVLMAQIGSFVPCDYAEFLMVDAIFSRVGAEDCQMKGLSTFMVEMIETTTIINTATENSLVIIDELGRGTSTYDGCGIAYAVADHLARETKCFTLFATHFFEITSLPDELPNVHNLHVSAVTKDDTITPLYQIKPGACDKSYGIHCAKIAKFPDDVIQNALKCQQKLEFATGTGILHDYDPVLRQQIIKEGNDIISSTKKRLQAMASLSDEELQAEFNKLKEEVKESKNLIIQELLSAKC